MIIGTAGHVDHGKTALVKALTGIDADRLAEEKRRGITIDLGYAYTDTLGFVDVPGHERFVHTMLAGASGIDAALLVVALDDGVMPQTREHVQILELLGIDRGVVALTKADIAADRAARRRRGDSLAARRHRAGVGAAAAGIGDRGRRDRGSAVLHCDALGPRARAANQYPRLAVDRAFTLTGAGLVLTGTLVSGRIRVEDRLMLSPAGIELRVRGLHAQNRPADAGDSRPARRAECRRAAAVEGCGEPRRLGAASRRACADRSRSTSVSGCWRRRSAPCVRMLRRICISARRM